MQKDLGAFQTGKHEDSEVRIVCHVPEKEGRLVLSLANEKEAGRKHG